MNPFTKTTQAKMAACAALGLSYWSDHPGVRCVWAVNDRQQAFVVKIYKSGHAALQNEGDSYMRTIYDKRGTKSVKVIRTYDAGDRVPFAA
ncbi:hypothetical protein KIV66_gp77 [Mycobacterium phage MyraDee]|uniref:Uncharacterized protein n=1 Tax=Mycobacterium phage MyraDee TaxID=2024303 RepID=A0A222YZD4_9CAUD|nr:hypothetical protein KIV66_gp77 [Mycobacterium phage MyraDee]ASR77184.1 hypothetical protein SEA_MYRADEE_77 [Mycobacterium phage MyraDee]